MRCGGRLLVVSVLGLLLATGCSDSDSPAASPEPTSEEATPTSPAPVATQVTPVMPGDARFEVAFKGLPKLERPIAMVEVPGQARMMVALQDGRILAFAKDPGASTLDTVLDHRMKTSRDGNEEGLLGLALDPSFERNGFLYAYYSAVGGQRRTVLSRFSTSGTGTSLHAEPESELVILEVPQPFANHNGGALVFGPDGMLYLGLGDGGAAGDPQGNGQDVKRNLLGSIIRIDVRNATGERPYAIPPDNPFVNGTAGARKETWAYGLRNPWRISFDRETGNLWAGDVGQNAHEEIDLVEKGRNYGWNVMEGASCYKPANGCPREGLTLPVADYPQDAGACSVTGGYVYRGKALPALRGWYVYADFCNGAVWTFDTAAAGHGDNPAVTVLRARGPSIASFAEDAAGELYMLAFDGKVYRLVP